MGSVLVAAVLLAAAPALAQRTADAGALFEAAERAGRVGEARRTRPVDARPARPGEVVASATGARTAIAGDWVVRARCPAAGNAQDLVAGRLFPFRYRPAPAPPDAAGWREFHPVAAPVQFFVLSPAEGAIALTAPWGEVQRAVPGDAILRDPAQPRDVYRIEAASFACAYEITRPPAR